MAQEKYKFPQDTTITKWPVGDWREDTCREMIIAGIEWLDRERTEHVLGLDEGTQFERLIADARGPRVKSAELDSIMLSILEQKKREQYVDSQVVFTIAVHIIFFVCQYGWEQFVSDFEKAETERIGKLN